MSKRTVALIRGASGAAVSVCRRTGSLRSQAAPALAFAAQKIAPTTFSLEDSLRYIEGSLAAGELHATQAVHRGVLQMRELQRKQEELMFEDEMLGAPS